jgi:hypothetical protein
VIETNNLSKININFISKYITSSLSPMSQEWAYGRLAVQLVKFRDLEI